MLDGHTGRFLSADPTVPGAGLTQAFNRYSYTYDSPLSYTDPTGFTPLPFRLNIRDYSSRAGFSFGRVSLFGFDIPIRGSWSLQHRKARASLPPKLKSGCFAAFVTVCTGKGAFKNGPWEIQTDKMKEIYPGIEVPEWMVLNIWNPDGIGLGESSEDRLTES